MLSLILQLEWHWKWLRFYSICMGDTSLESLRLALWAHMPIFFFSTIHMWISLLSRSEFSFLSGNPSPLDPNCPASFGGDSGWFYLPGTPFWASIVFWKTTSFLTSVHEGVMVMTSPLGSGVKYKTRAWQKPSFPLDTRWLWGWTDVLSQS